MLVKLTDRISKIKFNYKCRTDTVDDSNKCGGEQPGPPKMRLNYKCKIGTVDDSNKCDEESNRSGNMPKGDMNILIPGYNITDKLSIMKNNGVTMLAPSKMKDKADSVSKVVGTVSRILKVDPPMMVMTTKRNPQDADYSKMYKRDFKSSAVYIPARTGIGPIMGVPASIIMWNTNPDEDIPPERYMTAVHELFHHRPCKVL